MKKKRIRRSIFGRVFWRDATLSIDEHAQVEAAEDRMYIKENYGIISFDNPEVLVVSSEFDNAPGEKERKRTRSVVTDIPRQWVQHIEQHITGNKWRKIRI